MADQPKIRFPIRYTYFDGSEGPPAEMVEYQTARHILYKLGLKVRRQGDGVLIAFKPHDQGPSPFYAPVKTYPEGESAFYLMVDEGFFEDVLVDRFNGVEFMGLEVLKWHQPWWELIPYIDILQTMTKILVPDFQAEPSPYMGRGRSSRHYAKQRAHALENVNSDVFEFYTIKVDHP